MKLTLSPSGSVQVLRVQGPLDTHTVEVLRAGVTKMLRAGKNRIVLHIENPGEFNTVTLGELAQFNGLARELAGELVLSGLPEELKTRVLAFSKPPAVRAFANEEEAVTALKPKAAAKEAAKNTEVAATAPAATSIPEGTPAHYAQMLTQRDEEIAKLREQLRLKEQNELGELREANEKLKREVEALEETLFKESELLKNLPGDAATLNKLEFLEAQVGSLTTQLQVAEEKLEKAAAQKK